MLIEKQKEVNFAKHFQNITDPRRKKKSIRHKLIDIIAIAICATISGADNWDDIELYGKEKEVWLRTFLEIPNGIPSHDTLNRVFASIDPEELRKGFIGWVQEIVELTRGSVVAIDGKTVRRAYRNKQYPLHMVSAWAKQNKLVLGQIKAKEKSNEITAIPKLLELLVLKGCVITIDAMGCQKDIAEKIISKEADYVLALKGNQTKMHQEVKRIFKDMKEQVRSHEEIHTGHGRNEKRTCSRIVLKKGMLTDQKKWKNLKSVVKIESERTIKNKENKTAQETRYYISSLRTSEKKFNQIIRDHWSIENSLHWTLDMVFREDENRTRTGSADENLVILRHLAVNLLKQEKSLKRGVKAKRLKAGWDNSYLLKVLES